MFRNPFQNFGRFSDSKTRRRAGRRLSTEPLEPRCLLAAVVETGQNDFRISHSGDDRDAWNPSVAWNETDNEYLVVWAADDESFGLETLEYEIIGQIHDGRTGAVKTAPIRISHAGGTGSNISQTDEPSVAWNSVTNEYLVTWFADDTDSPGIVDGEYEIFGQILDSRGQHVGNDNFRISDAGSDGDTTYHAIRPQVVHNSVTNQFLVAWQARDDVPGITGARYEIFGQLLDDTGGDTPSPISTARYLNRYLFLNQTFHAVRYRKLGHSTPTRQVSQKWCWTLTVRNVKQAAGVDLDRMRKVKRSPAELRTEKRKW